MNPGLHWSQQSQFSKSFLVAARYGQLAASRLVLFLALGLLLLAAAPSCLCELHHAARTCSPLIWFCFSEIPVFHGSRVSPALLYYGNPAWRLQRSASETERRAARSCDSELSRGKREGRPCGTWWMCQCGWKAEVSCFIPLCDREVRIEEIFSSAKPAHSNMEMW